jgi:drug/metabolite transporter (DMT)-like permease
VPANVIAPARLFLLTSLAMICFAGNSLLCRLALNETAIDAATFTTVRLASGALTLWLIVRIRDDAHSVEGSWRSAAALFAYAIAFSYAYTTLAAGTGALLLFGAVQATMIGYGLWSGERLSRLQAAGFILAITGLVGLLLPGLSAPPLTGALLMIAAGIAWGVYSLRGAGGRDATQVTAGNFMRAVPFAIAVGAATLPWAAFDVEGLRSAVASGAIASGVGYSIWYTALRGLTATSAATIQLSVPVIAAAGGILFLGETLTLRLIVASVAILSGVAIVLRQRRRAPQR